MSNAFDSPAGVFKQYVGKYELYPQFHFDFLVRKALIMHKPLTKKIELIVIELNQFVLKDLDAKSPFMSMKMDQFKD